MIESSFNNRKTWYHFKNSSGATYCSWDRTLTALRVLRDLHVSSGPCLLLPPHPEFSKPSLVAQMVMNLPAVQETWFWSLGLEDPLGKGMATHFSILAWRIPWTEEPGGLKSTGSQSVGLRDFHFLSLCHFRFSRNRFHGILK